MHFPAKPSELAFGKAARGLLNFPRSFQFSERAGKVCAPFRIAYKLKRFGIRGDAALGKTRDFLDPPGCNHGIDARMNAIVERGTWGRQSDFYWPVPLERCATAAMKFSYWLPGDKSHFNRADYFLAILRGYACC